VTTLVDAGVEESVATTIVEEAIAKVEIPATKTPVVKKPTVKTPATKTPVANAQEPALVATAATPAAKTSDMEETWLGGRFLKNIAPAASLASLFAGNTQMGQESKALSSLRQASGIDEAPKTPESDYYSYGSEPSYSNVLKPFMGGGTVQGYAKGGTIMSAPLMAASAGEAEHKGSHYVQGAGGGQDDLIPAKLADGEYVFDAEIVSALGDGSNKEGARKLDAWRESIRKHKRSGPLSTIPPKAKSPLAYMKGIK